MDLLVWKHGGGNLAGVIIWRSLDGSYLPGGRFFVGGHFAQAVSAWSVGPSTALLALRLSYSVSCHYNAPRFYAQLKDRSAASFEGATRRAFGAAALIYAVLIVCSVRTFGVTGCRVPILSSYAVTDPLASLARWMMVVSSITIYPLIFSAAEQPCIRILGMLFRGREVENRDRKRAMVGLSAAVGLLGLLLDDLGKFSSLMGAFFCALFVWMMPAMLGVAVARSRHGRGTSFLRMLGPCAAFMIGAWQFFYGMNYILRGGG